MCCPAFGYRDRRPTDGGGKRKTIANPWDPNGRLDRCPTAHREIFMRHAEAERELGINYFFTDCTTTGGSIHECYHPDHPVIQSEGAAALSQALSDVGGLGMLVWSERGKWWATGSTHVFEGIEKLIRLELGVLFTQYLSPKMEDRLFEAMKTSRPKVKEPWH